MKLLHRLKDARLHDFLWLGRFLLHWGSLPRQWDLTVSKYDRKMEKEIWELSLTWRRRK